ncbi:MAG TPA: hypothetical protein PKD24_07045 [Pyrinomonadaceae bacterium]|nr:hypothetical protein [Pyrinomonadaceae bacterium]HMP65085.1 hypothetical protein [Pyrinomonadaceae bacterium]
MSQEKRELTPADIELGYERNEIQLKGILYFGFGLLILVVITFLLMWLLLGVMEDEAKVRQASNNPMRLGEIDRLPPEPRLQGAPGFGVDSPEGRINLELTVPQAEYWKLRDQWEKLRKEGMAHPETGALIALPIDQAKEEFLKRPINAPTGPEAEKEAKSSLRYLTDASSGRIASGKRR